MCMVVDREQNREDDAFLREDLIDDDAFELMWYIVPPLGPVFTHELSLLS